MSVKNIFIECCSDGAAGFITPVDSIAMIDFDDNVWLETLDDNYDFVPNITNTVPGRKSFVLKDVNGYGWKFYVDTNGVFHSDPKDFISDGPSFIAFKKESLTIIIGTDTNGNFTQKEL